MSENGGYKGDSHVTYLLWPFELENDDEVSILWGKAAHVDLPLHGPCEFPRMETPKSGINGSQQSLGRKGREQEIFGDMPSRIVLVAFFATRRRKIGKTLANYHWACLEIRGSNCPN